MSVYAAQFIMDLSNDGIPEILAVHGGDELSDPSTRNKMFGRLIVFDGKNGDVLRWMETPDRMESYYAPQVFKDANGNTTVLFGTGGNSRSGSLFTITLDDLLSRKVSRSRIVYSDPKKGMLTPAALVDVNGDGVKDIVVATFYSNVIAFDGKTYDAIWNTTFADSESYATISVGYWNEDDTPDFLVKYQYGKEGYPVYQYETVNRN